jgi:hypothetical protein
VRALHAEISQKDANALDARATSMRKHMASKDPAVMHDASESFEI